MAAPENTIVFTLYYRDEEYRIQTHHNAHYSLMTLISDELQLPGYGICCGMGSCGTCLVEIADTAQSARRPYLACGLQVNDMLANKHIYIPGNF